MNLFVCLTLFLAFLAHPARAEKVTIRLVARDLNRTVPVSDLRGYYMASGGLVAVEWTGGVQVDDVPIFPPIPRMLEEGGKEKDEFLDEVAKVDPAAVERQRQLVDPLYWGKDVGPEFLRPSAREVELAGRDFLLTPGNIPFRIEKGIIQVDDSRTRVDPEGVLEIECVPLTLTAAASRDDPVHRPFRPTLTFNGRNLLEDILFEPDEFYMGRKQTGSRTTYLHLTLYLVPNRANERKFTDYRLEDVPFYIDRRGVELAGASASIRQAGPNHLVIEQAVAETVPPEREMLVFNIGPPEYHQIVVRSNPGNEWFSGSVPLPLDSNPRRVLYFVARTACPEHSGGPWFGDTPFSMTCDFDRYPVRVAVIENRRAGQELPAVYLFSHHYLAESTALRVHITGVRGKENLLSSRAAIPARLRRGYFDGDKSWGGTPIRLRPSDQPGVWETPLPAGFSGLVTLTFPDFLDPALWIELPFVVAPPAASGSVTLLTPKGRVHFQVGEKVEIHAVGRSREPVTEMVALMLEHGREPLPICSFPLEIGKLPATHTFQLDTRFLKPGRYLVSGRTEKLVIHSLGFELYAAEPPTDYPSVAMKPFSHETPDWRIGYLRHLMGANPGAAMGNRMPEERFVFERSGRLPASLARILDSDPLLPVSEKAQGMDSLGQMLSLGIAEGCLFYWEPTAGYTQYNIKHTTAIDNARSFRLQQYYVQRARGIPSFGGLANFWHAPLYGYWEGSPPIDGHQPLRNQQVATDFTAATQMAIPTAQERQSLRTGKGDPVAFDDIRKRLLAWHYWEAGALPKAFRIWHDAMDEIQRGLWLLNRPPSGWALGSSSYPPTFFGPLDAVSTYNITDFGRMPFDLPFGAAISGAGISNDRPKFIHAWTFSRAGALAEGLLGLTNGADAVDPSSNEFVSHNIPGLYSTYDRRQVMEIFSRYGNFVRRLDAFKDVAVLFSARQAWGEADESHALRVRSLFHDLLRCRRGVTILLDEDLAKGKLQGHRALFLLGMTCPRPESEMKAFQEFERTGGRIFTDEGSLDLYPGERVTLWKSAPPGYPPGDGEFEFVKVWEDFLKRQDALQTALGRVPAPFASSDSPRRLLGFKAGKNLQFVAVINDELIPLEIKDGRYRQDYAVPVKATVQFDKPSTVYDLLEGAVRHGAKSLDLDFTRVEARLLVLFPKPLETLRVQMQARLEAGEALALAAEVRDAGGQTVEDPLPYEIEVASPSGQTRWHWFRTLAPGEVLKIPTATNDEGGQWSLSVKELVSGLETTARFALAPAGSKKDLANALPEVLIYDAEAIAQFFDRKRRLKLLLEPGQAGLLNAVKKIAEACQAAGRPAEVKVVQPDEIHAVPLRWQRTRRDKELWAALEAGDAIGLRHNLRTYVDPKQKVDYVMPDSGYDDPGPQHLILDDVILVGPPGANRFLDEALTLAPRRVSPHFPGPGRGLIQFVWSPFWEQRHVVTVTASDEAGLHAGMERLAELISRPPAERPAAAESATASHLQFAALPASKQRGKLPHFVSERMGSPVVSLSVSPDGASVAVGTRFFGPNLFLLDNEGRILWKEHVGLDGPSRVEVTAGAERVYAAAGDQLLIFDRSGKAVARMTAPLPSVSANAWSPGPATLWMHPHVADFFMTGARTVQRVGADGSALWQYSDVPWCSEALDFYYHRGVFLKALSPDGDRLLVSLFGTVVGELGYLSSYWKPGLAMLDASTGEVLWHHQGLVVNNTMAVIEGKRAVVYDDDGSIHVFDAQGRKERSFAFPPGVEAMALAPDGRTLLLQTAMARDAIRRPYGRSMHLMRLDLETTEAHRYETEGEIRDFAISPRGEFATASTWEGRINFFRLSGEKLWEHKLEGGSALIRFHPSSNSLIAGTATGQLLWLNLEGKELHRLDLMPFNQPDAGWVRTVLDDRAFPEQKIKPLEGNRISIFERARNFVSFQFYDLGSAFGKTCRIHENAIETPPIQFPANSTFLVGFFVQAEGEWNPVPYDRVRVTAVAGDQILYEASMPLAKTWAERVVSFRTGRDARRVLLRFTPERYRPFTVGLVASGKEKTEKVKPVVPFVVEKVQWAKVNYRSRNLLRGRTADDFLDSGAAGVSDTGDVKARMEIPNPYPAVYPMSFIKPRLGEITFIDGVISGQETSWARGNSIEVGTIMEGANHPFRYASLYLTLPRPRPISVVCVYEDNTGPIPIEKSWQGMLLREKTTSSFAILLRNAETKKWTVLGSAQGNVNVFNLFAGPPVLADMVHYFWAGGGDWHIRLAELEAYMPVGETDEDLESAEEEGKAADEEEKEGGQEEGLPE